MSAAPALDTIRQALKRVADPEIGANIVDLGLIYRLDYEDNRLVIDLTMTSPACPMGDLIVDDIHAELARLLPDTVEADVRIVWDPPWHPGLMSPDCRLHLGWRDDPAS